VRIERSLLRGDRGGDPPAAGHGGRSSWVWDDGATERSACDDSGGWQPGDVDPSEYLDRYRSQRLVLIIGPVGEAEPATYTCGVCGFVMNEAGECPRCKLGAEEAGREERGEGKPDILDQVRELLDGTGQAQT
jgi:hypothetical protein